MKLEADHAASFPLWMSSGLSGPLFRKFLEAFGRCQGS